MCYLGGGAFSDHNDIHYRELMERARLEGKKLVAAQPSGELCVSTVLSRSCILTFSRTNISIYSLYGYDLKLLALLIFIPVVNYNCLSQASCIVDNGV